MAPKNNPYLWRALGGGALIGGAAGFGLNYLLPQFLPPGSSPFWLLVFLPAFAFAALIHECGHLAAARLEGLALLYWAAGPLLFRRTGSRMRPSWEPGLLFAGSITSMAPAELTGLREKLITWVAGGPVASFLLVALSTMTWLWTWSAGSMHTAWCAFAFASASVVVFSATTLPWEASGFASDGTHLVHLVRRLPTSDRWCALAALAAMAERGPRPSQWDLRVLARAVQLEDGSPDEARARLYHFYSALDSGNASVAAADLDRLSEINPGLPVPLQPDYWLERAYFAGYYIRDAAQSARALERAGAAPLSPPYRVARARAAALFAAGSLDEAVQTARAALEEDRIRHAEGLATAERTWLNYIVDPSSLVWQSGIDDAHARD